MVEQANDSMADFGLSIVGAARKLTVELAPSIIAVSQMLTELAVNARMAMGEFSAAGTNVSGFTQVVALTADWAQAVKLAAQGFLIVHKAMYDIASGNLLTSPLETLRETGRMAGEFGGI